MTPGPGSAATPRWRWGFAAVGAMALALAGCGVNPVTGERQFMLISESEEIEIGEEHFGSTQQAMGGRYSADPELVAYVSEVGQRVAAESARPELPYEFVVVNDSTPNAWALPGGKIGIHRGLLTAMDNEAELAAVLGHEVVHSAARHGAQRMERGLVLQAGMVAVGIATRDHDLHALMVAGAGIGTALISQQHSRSAELEADYYGTRYMAKAGYDPEGAVTLQQKFVELAGKGERSWVEGLFASHPPSEQRVQANRETAETLRHEFPDRQWRLGEEAYQERVAVLHRNEDAYRKLEEGRQALAEGDAARALRLAEDAAEQVPEEAAFHGLRGQALAEQGRDEQALAALDRAIELDPEFFQTRLARGSLRRAAGDGDGAREDLERANALLPTAPAHYQLGRLAEERGETDAAARHYEIAAESRTEVGERAREALAELR